METPNITNKVLAGHFGTFAQNSSINIGEFNNPMGLMTEIIRAVNDENFNAGKLTFIALNSPPHLFLRQSESSFRVWGPLFTLFVETAIYLNYSVSGAVPDVKNVYPAIANVKPDLLLGPMWPQLRLFQMMVLSKKRNNCY